MLFQLSAAVLSSGPRGALRPLRMIAAIVLGRASLDPSYSAVAAGLVGTIVHLCLAATFGLLFGVLLLAAAQIDVVMGGRTLVLAGGAYGLVLWPINFYSVAPLAGLSWFPQYELTPGAVRGPRLVLWRGARTVLPAADRPAGPHDRPRGAALIRRHPCLVPPSALPSAQPPK